MAAFFVAEEGIFRTFTHGFYTRQKIRASGKPGNPCVEQMTGIEPASRAWEARVLLDEFYQVHKSAWLSHFFKFEFYPMQVISVNFYTRFYTREPLPRFFIEERRP